MDGGDLLVRAHLKDSAEYEAAIRQGIILPILQGLNCKSNSSSIQIYIFRLFSRES
jgi:hypothetical protein